MAFSTSGVLGQIVVIVIIMTEFYMSLRDTLTFLI
jgi:hypothetical protein